MSMSRTFHEHRTFLLAALAGAVATMIAFAGLSRAESFSMPSISLATASASSMPLATSSPVFALAASADAGPLSALDPAAPVVAPSLTVPPDPIDNPGGALDSARSAWRDGGWLGVSLVGVYLLILIVKRYVSWLATGRRAVVVAALMTALVTAIATFTGGTPTLAWAINALVAGVLLYLRPETPPVPTPQPLSYRS